MNVPWFYNMFKLKNVAKHSFAILFLGNNLKKHCQTSSVLSNHWIKSFSAQPNLRIEILLVQERCQTSPNVLFLTKCFKLKLVYHRSNQEICRGPHWLNIFSSSLVNGNWIIYLIKKNNCWSLVGITFKGLAWAQLMGSNYGLMTLFWASSNTRSDEFT